MAFKQLRISLSQASKPRLCSISASQILQWSEGRLCCVNTLEGLILSFMTKHTKKRHHENNVGHVKCLLVRTNFDGPAMPRGAECWDRHSGTPAEPELI